MKSILTILLTSLFWAFVIFLFFEPRSSQESTEPIAQSVVAKDNREKQTGNESASTPRVARTTKSKNTTHSKDKSATNNKSQNINGLDYSHELIGKWIPIEGGRYPLEFTKYGCVIQTNALNWRSNYSLNGKQLKIKYDNAKIEITKENGTVYLELFNSAEFSGKYKRVSKPRHIDMTPIDKSIYHEKIVGKWKPIDGQEVPIEFTKYGTAIRTEFTLERRYDYTLNGSSLKILYDNARVTISEDASYYYLEIYNSEDFSGRYRKSK